MKQTTTSYFTLTVLVIASLAIILTACERPLQPDLDDDVAQPAPVIQPELEIPSPIIEEEAAPEIEIGEPPDDADPPDETVVEPPPEAPAPTEPAEETDGIYIVQPGDTLGRIAQRYNVTVEDLAAANNIVNIHRLEIGQRLIIPGRETAPAPPADPTEERIHIVQRGENLYRIGLLYGYTWQTLAEYNGIANPNRLEVGQEIRIPPNP